MKKNIFITGAASGIGKATSLLFAKMGWYVGMFDLDESKLAALHKEIGEENGCFKFIDVTNVESVNEAVSHFSEKTDTKMDVLFNCAGILKMDNHEKIALQFQKKIIDVNVNGILNCIDASFDKLKNTDNSKIINMSSASAVYGAPELAVYSSSKFAIRGLTEALNIEFEKYGIWVCDIMAPYVQTPMITSAENKATSVEKLGVGVTPEQVAKIILKATKKKKVHWLISTKLKFMVVGNKLGNSFINRKVMKFLAH